MFRSICSRLTCSATPQRPARQDRPLSPEKSADETWKEIEDRCSPNLKELLELVNLQAKARFNCMYFWGEYDGDGSGKATHKPLCDRPAYKALWQGQSVAVQARVTAFNRLKADGHIIEKRAISRRGAESSPATPIYETRLTIEQLATCATERWALRKEFCDPAWPPDEPHWEAPSPAPPLSVSPSQEPPHSGRPSALPAEAVSKPPRGKLTQAKVDLIKAIAKRNGHRPGTTEYNEFVAIRTKRMLEEERRSPLRR